MTLKSLFERFAEQLGQGVYASLSESMTDVGKDYVDTRPSLAQSLQIRTGGLLRSFLPKQKQSLFAYQSSERGLEVTVGSRMVYARIHEFGGTIRAKKYKQTRRGLYPSMALYFLARAKQTGSPYYRNLFLAVLKKRSVTIPARHYFSKGLADFQRKHFPRLLTNFLKRLLTEYANKELTNEKS